jgi:hypothetical protein
MHWQATNLVKENESEENLSAKIEALTLVGVFF